MWVNLRYSDIILIERGHRKKVFMRRNNKCILKDDIMTDINQLVVEAMSSKAKKRFGAGAAISGAAILGAGAAAQLGSNYLKGKGYDVGWVPARIATGGTMLSLAGMKMYKDEKKKDKQAKKSVVKYLKTGK